MNRSFSFRFGYILLLSTFIFLIFACKNNLIVEDRNVRTEKSGNDRGAFDPKPFFDVTMRNVDAREVGNDEFNALCSGCYEHRESGSSIYINTRKNLVNVNIRDCQIPEFAGKTVSFEYEYKFTGAGKNLAYLSPVKPRQVKVCIGEEVYSSKDLGNFALYISLYGFGEGRIEVSPHLKDVSCIIPGTYWHR